jgi:hypothetical protein
MNYMKRQMKCIGRQIIQPHQVFLSRFAGSNLRKDIMPKVAKSARLSGVARRTASSNPIPSVVDLRAIKTATKAATAAGEVQVPSNMHDNDKHPASALDDELGLQAGITDT